MTLGKQRFLIGIVTLVVGVVLTLFIPKRLDEQGVAFLKQVEGFRACPYQDQGGVWTIGYGTTYYDIDWTVSPDDDCITQSEAEYFLRKSAAEVEYCVHKNVFSEINQAQFNALCSFAYNVGEAAFIRSRLLKTVNENPDNPAIIREFYRWVYVKGKYNDGLRNRRVKEINLYFSTQYTVSNNPPVSVKPDNIDA